MANEGERYSILGSEIASVRIEGEDVVMELKTPQYHIKYQDYLKLLRDPSKKADAAAVENAVRMGKISVV